MEYLRQAPVVSVHSEIVVVAAETAGERGMLFFLPEVPVAAAPPMYGLKCPLNTRLASLHPESPSTSSISPPKQRETQKIESLSG
jgi:hypothetical protein